MKNLQNRVEVIFNPFESDTGFSVEDFCAVEIQGFRNEENNPHFHAYLRRTDKLNKNSLIHVAGGKDFKTVMNWAFDLSTSLGYRMNVRFNPKQSLA